MKGCGNLDHVAFNRRLRFDSFTANNMSQGKTRISLECACSRESLRGPKYVECRRDRMWEPGDLPSCESDWFAPFTPREYLLSGIAAACLLTLISIVIALVVISRRKTLRRKISTKRLKDRLGRLSPDPLDDVIRREVAKRESQRSQRSARGGTPWQTHARDGRQLFRVWNHDGSKRERILASTLEELTTEACEKFQLGRSVIIVLELDGKQIRSSEELGTHSAKLLVALEGGQEWRPIRGQHQFDHLASLSLSKSLNNSLDSSARSHEVDELHSGGLDGRSSTRSEPATHALADPDRPEVTPVGVSAGGGERSVHVYTIQTPDESMQAAESERASLPNVAHLD